MPGSSSSSKKAPNDVSRLVVYTGSSKIRSSKQLDKTAVQFEQRQKEKAKTKKAEEKAVKFQKHIRPFALPRIPQTPLQPLHPHLPSPAPFWNGAASPRPPVQPLPHHPHSEPMARLLNSTETESVHGTPNMRATNHAGMQAVLTGPPSQGHHQPHPGNHYPGPPNSSGQQLHPPISQAAHSPRPQGFPPPSAPPQRHPNGLPPAQPLPPPGQGYQPHESFPGHVPGGPSPAPGQHHPPPLPGQHPEFNRGATPRGNRTPRPPHPLSNSFIPGSDNEFNSPPAIDVPNPSFDERQATPCPRPPALGTDAALHPQSVEQQGYQRPLPGSVSFTPNYDNLANSAPPVGPSSPLQPPPGGHIELIGVQNPMQQVQNQMQQLHIAGGGMPGLRPGPVAGGYGGYQGYDGYGEEEEEDSMSLHPGHSQVDDGIASIHSKTSKASSDTMSVRSGSSKTSRASSRRGGGDDAVSTYSGRSHRSRRYVDDDTAFVPSRRGYRQQAWWWMTWSLECKNELWVKIWSRQK
ncbi:hypothetical protein QBC35DRAFT_448691 [Podospora australis]|uniref:Uncharacterized protein n=1 Tax=Podospora australis TaxID=1536484 RepID=A0AAN6WZ43_9PEZI|nr:hypothetical protein QBC35DRAFT_448691 [Podospora australis]